MTTSWMQPDPPSFVTMIRYAIKGQLDMLKTCVNKWNVNNLSYVYPYGVPHQQICHKPIYIAQIALLHAAACHPDCVEWLIKDCEAFVNIASTGRLTPLTFAVIQLSYEGAAKLIELGASVNSLVNMHELCNCTTHGRSMRAIDFLLHHRNNPLDVGRMMRLLRSKKARSASSVDATLIDPRHDEIALVESRYRRKVASLVLIGLYKFRQFAVKRWLNRDTMTLIAKAVDRMDYDDDVHVETKRQHILK